MITIDNFEGIVPYKILMRGEEYYESGAVSDLKETLPASGLQPLTVPVVILWKYLWKEIK